MRRRFCAATYVMSAAVATDSVPLETLEERPTTAKVGATDTQPPRSQTLKLLLSIFLTFIFVVSQIFVGNVLSAFGEKAVIGRTPTTWGVMLQALFMVIGYAIAAYLIKHGIV